MRSFVNRFGNDAARGSRLLQSLPQIRSLSFSTAALHSSKKPEFNVLLFCPRSEEHMEKFRSEYPEFIKSSTEDSIKSVSVTDVAHNPENNRRAIEMLMGRGISPSMIIPHIALIAHSKDDADEKIRFFRDNGIQSMFVVRGNPLVIGKDLGYDRHPQGYEDVGILMKRIKELAPNMKLVVAAYPSKHLFAKSPEQDMDELKRKVDFGADSIITQHFFDNQVFLGFLDQCQKRGINLPVMPTILPIGNPKYLVSFSRGAGVDVPGEVIEILFKRGVDVSVDDSFIKDKKTETRAAEYTARQIQSLVDLDLPQVQKVNTYTANNANFLRLVFKTLGIEKDSSRDQTRT